MRNSPKLAFFGIRRVGGNLEDKALQERILDFFAEYIDIFLQKAHSAGLPTRSLSFGSPTNYYFFVDSNSLHCIFTSQFAGDIPDVYFVDLRSEGQTGYSAESFAQYLKLGLWTTPPLSEGSVCTNTAKKSSRKTQTALLSGLAAFLTNYSAV